MPYDFISIGDTVTDAFIRLKDASVHCDINRERCVICMRFADKVPYEEVHVVPAVGNSANASVAAARLGLTSALVSNVGDDYYGKECLDALRAENVSTEFVGVNAGFKTNYHYVLWYEDDRTILIKHEEYNYTLPNVGESQWLYLSSAGPKSLEFHGAIEKYLSEHPNVKLAFQPGTFQMKLKNEILGIYRRADIFFCNREEAQRILGVEEHDIKKLLQLMHNFGPKTVVITDGPKGAYAYDGSIGLTTGGKMLFMRAYPDPKPPYERTGAGDAFSSTVVAALALGKDLKGALRWGPINSMSVVQQVGARAGLLSRQEIEKYLAQAPADYEPSVI
ncbi:MAG: carbohydrate kinase family protein [Candidatus Sungbacteria bacterium]|nr:carbohydrate kinase family protein [Candidatus Sungbacteria bacterium]